MEYIQIEKTRNTTLKFITQEGRGRGTNRGCGKFRSNIRGGGIYTESCYLSVTSLHLLIFNADFR